ncbi:MAG: prepilin-type N-terminal cleavage/methylation domain-containing protein [Candidatus Aminicenantales bacterium]
MKKRGFTLIEVLIVIAVIGILVSIVLPIFKESMQKARQKGTMYDIHSLAKSITLYLSDVGVAPTNPEGAITPGNQFLRDLAPFHIKAIPINDQWGNALRVWTGTAVSGEFGIEIGDVGDDDYLIQSLGSDGLDEGFIYDRENPQDFYPLNSILDFRKDLIQWNGQWIHAPRAAQSGS